MPKDSIQVGTKTIEMASALLKEWLDARYLSDEGYPEFVRPTALELRTITSELLQCGPN